MPQRRINDAQVDRLLASLQSLPYRQKLARKIAEKDNIKYASAMRRLQRYVTKGAQKSSFARAPLPIRRETVKIARGLPTPVKPTVDRRPLSPEPTVDRRPQTVKPKQLDLPRPAFYQEIPPSELRSSYRPPVKRDAPDNYEYRAILAYFDGDADEAAKALREFGAPASTSSILQLTAKSVDVMNVVGIGRLSDAAKEWFDIIAIADLRDIEDFSDLLREGEMAEWKVEIILEDLANGDSTFSDWMDVWRDSGMDYDAMIDAEDNEYWKLWRAAYARAKK